MILSLVTVSIASLLGLSTAEDDKLSARLVTVEVVPSRFFLVTTVVVTFINTIPNGFSFLPLAAPAPDAKEAPVGAMPIRSESSKDIPASSPFPKISPVIALPALADDLDGGRSRLRRFFAAAADCVQLSLLAVLEESLEYVVAPMPFLLVEPAPDLFRAFDFVVAVVIFVVGRDNGRKDFKRRQCFVSSLVVSLCCVFCTTGPQVFLLCVFVVAVSLVGGEAILSAKSSSSSSLEEVAEELS